MRSGTLAFEQRHWALSTVRWLTLGVWNSRFVGVGALDDPSEKFDLDGQIFPLPASARHMEFAHRRERRPRRSAAARRNYAGQGLAPADRVYPIYFVQKPPQTQIRPAAFLRQTPACRKTPCLSLWERWPGVAGSERVRDFQRKSLENEYLLCKYSGFPLSHADA